MNERIKELMQKAQVEVRISIDPHTFHQYPDPNGPHTIIEFSAEKFAELVVRECGQYLNSPEFIGRSDLDWAMVLNEHFGVEE